MDTVDFVRYSQDFNRRQKAIKHLQNRIEFFNTTGNTDRTYPLLIVLNNIVQNKITDYSLIESMGMSFER